MILIGYGANKIGWIPIEASKYLSKLVINIAAPCVVIVSFAGKEKDPENLKTLGLLCIISIGGFIISWLISTFFVKITKVPKQDVGVYKNFLVFSNSGFMGFPVSYALFGAEGLFYMVIFNSVPQLFLYTFGVATIKRSAGLYEKEKFKISKLLRNFITPPLIAVVVGLIIYFLQLPIHSELLEFLSTLGGIMTPLCMIIIGLQLTESKIKEFVGNWRLYLMSAFRLVIIPIVFAMIIIPFGLDKLIESVTILNFLLPCAAVPVTFAEEFGGNAKLAAEGTFLSTLLSIITIPVAMLLLTMLY